MTDLTALPRLLATSDWPAAERLLRRAARTRGAPAPVFYNLAKVLEAQGKTDQRETWLKRALAADATHAAAWFELGRLHLEAHRLDSAEDAFARALRLEPGDEQARRLLMRLRLRRCDWHGAAAMAQALPDDAETRAAAYRVAAETGQDTTALRAAMLSDPASRPLALKTLTRVARGTLPLRLPPL